MPDVNVKETIMTMEASLASSKSYGKIEEIRMKEAGGEPLSLLAPKKAENPQSKTVKYYVGAATPKACQANNP